MSVARDSRDKVPVGVEPTSAVLQTAAWPSGSGTEVTESKQGRKDSNLVREFWRLAALPGAHLCQQTSRRPTLLLVAGWRRVVRPVSRILFYAIISLGTYQTIDALLTGSGLFGLHPPRSSRYWTSGARPPAVLCLVKQ